MLVAVGGWHTRQRVRERGILASSGAWLHCSWPHGWVGLAGDLGTPRWRD